MGKRIFTIILSALIALNGAPVCFGAEQEGTVLLEDASASGDGRGQDPTDPSQYGPDEIIWEDGPEEEFNPADLIEEELPEEILAEDELIFDELTEENTDTDEDLTEDVLSEEDTLEEAIEEEAIEDEAEKTGASGISSAVITGLYNSQHGADLRWDRVPGAERYVIYRTNGGKTQRAAVVDGFQTSYMDTSVKNSWGKVYAYYVCSQKGSEISPRAQGKILQRVPPMRISSLKNTQPGIVKIEWAPAVDVNLAHGYEIQYAASLNDLYQREGSFKTFTAAGRKSLSGTITNLQYGKTYYFRVRAYSIYTHSQTHEETLTWSQYSPAKSLTLTARSATRYRAVVVGESKYSGTDYPRLEQSRYDAMAMRETLKNYGYTVVKREDLSSAAITDTVKDAFRNATQFDISLFYYNGHAADDGSLYTVDDTKLQLSELAKVLRTVPGRVVIILDCCFAGSGLAMAGSTADAGRIGGIAPDVFNQMAINAFAEEDPGLEDFPAADPEVPRTGTGELRDSKFYVLTACGENELSYGINNTYAETGEVVSYAFFTYAFTEGAGCLFPSGMYKGLIPADVNKDNQLTMEEVFNYTREKTYELSKEAGETDPSILPQHVQCWPENSEEVIMKKN